MEHTYQNYLIKDWQPHYRQDAANVIRKVLEEYHLPWQPTEADIDVLEVEKFYLQKGGEFWLVEDIFSQKIIGTSAYYPIKRGQNAVEIRKMYLLPNHRGKGLGKFLLTELETTIKTKGYQEIWIETASVLQEAVNLYENYSYQPAQGVETKRCDRVYVKYL